MNFFLTQCYRRYTFLDFSSMDEVNICLLTVHGSHFDKSHQLLVNHFTNIEKFVTVTTSSPGDGKALRGRQTWAQPLGWPLSHWVCWVVSEMVWGYHS